MFKNYLKTALRNLSRQRGTAFVNVLGLMLGISGSIILFLLLSHILTFDKFQENYDRIYRVVSEDEGNDGKNYSGGVPSPLPVAFRNDFPEAKEVAFTSYQAGGLILIPLANDEFKKFQEESGIVYTEPSLFKIFTIPAIIGDPVSGIGKPNEAVLSRSQALKYFGKEDAVGEVISYDKKDFKVTAIVEDPKDNSDFPFTVFLSYETVRKEIEAHGWGSTWSDENCYFLLKEGLDVKEVNQRMAAFTDKYIGKENHSHRLYMTQPLSTIHYDDRFGSYTYNTTNVGTILALIVIAVFLVLTACINFINLATAEAIKRSKEV
ncbi:MAG TPA: ABC transporter permease, partial [Cyclobacteriaceae bacterium]|nr:ABC transporter permease [Cyclobacteriaceae bacterium]